MLYRFPLNFNVCFWIIDFVLIGGEPAELLFILVSANHSGSEAIMKSTRQPNTVRNAIKYGQDSRFKTQDSRLKIQDSRLETLET